MVSFVLMLLNLAWKGLALYMVLAVLRFLLKNGKGLAASLGDNLVRLIQIWDDGVKKKLLEKYRELHKEDQKVSEEDTKGA